MLDENPFAAANEQIVSKARELEIDGPIPLLCECADVRCRELVPTELSDFEAVRSPPAESILLTGHEPWPGRRP